MSISYHAIVGHKRNVTLPSVESCGANMNILRDPPKSIQTRKIDKVGETSEITQMIQDAGNRMGDAILMYARGVNPMVAVSYDNYGNNGGQTVKQSSSGTQAFLPIVLWISEHFDLLFKTKEASMRCLVYLACGQLLLLSLVLQTIARRLCVTETIRILKELRIKVKLLKLLQDLQLRIKLKNPFQNP